MNNENSKKSAILDVINLLKNTFDIHEDDQAIIVQSLDSKQKKLNSQLQELQRKQNDFQNTIRLEKQQVKKEKQEIRQQMSDVIRKKEALDSQVKSFEDYVESIKKRENLLKEKEYRLEKDLENVANLSKDDAIKLLCNKLENKARQKSETNLVKILNNASINASREAQKILAFAIQKETINVIDNCSTCSIELPDDSLKGKIIGREGRNIKAFEELTGTTVLIDDTPETIVISCYEPIRREIAKIAMTKLIVDGRIHPRRIESVVEAVHHEIDDMILNAGREVINELQILDVNEEIIKALGRLKYRTSYAQNVLSHCHEVAVIAANIASELKLDRNIALRAGLLHDIGKSIDRNVIGSHTELGYEFAKNYGESDIVCKCISEHHSDEISSIYVWIIKAADTLSSARPGVRHDTFDAYIKRLNELESIATSFDGIQSSYAMLAGRELRVVVEPDVISDDKAIIIADEIKNKIENSMNYPGQIMITVIRERRYSRLAT